MNRTTAFAPRARRTAVALMALGVTAAAASAQGTATRDPRVGLRAGMNDAAQAIWNLRLVSNTPTPADFRGSTNSDLAFSGNLVLQGNYKGVQVWDVSNPASPALRRGFVCPASQSDVSIYRNLLFVSGEGLEGRLDCGTEGARDPVSPDRLRGLRIFDVSDMANPRNVANVQTCRGSHTHTLLVHPNDPNNVYIYISGSAPVRSEQELAGCTEGTTTENPNTAEFRIEVIRVPLANPSQAAIVSSPRIFEQLTEAPSHGETQHDIEEARRQAAAARERGMFTATVFGLERVLPPRLVQPMLDSIVSARGGTGAATAADSAALRGSVQGILDRMFGANREGPRPGPTQCHDITVYPAIGLAGGACEGYGFLLDISDPVNPRRIAAVSDSNFSYWHSATFNNDGTKVLFTDEWGGGGGPKCRATDPREWGANAIFTINNRRDLAFQSYYKLPSVQTQFENCVAHNGSLIPIPGRDIMVQSWYQGGVSMFDWTDPRNPREIGFFDRGPADSTRMGNAGTWSVYWYNGHMYSSEMGRGLDVLELTPSEFLTQNEIDAANTVRLDYLNVQNQPKFVWPASFALSRAYTDQLQRSQGLPAARLAAVRQALSGAERASGAARRTALNNLATSLDRDAAASSDAAKVRMLVTSVRDLAR